MKILAIHGSMRKGNTYALTQEILRRLAAKPEVEITEISAAEQDLPFCQSCHTCFIKGEEFCPHDAVTREIRAALMECDGIILSGVAYMWSLNAAMKNLLDHFAYLFHRPALFGKYGMAVATAAGMGEKNVAQYLRTVLGQWGINGAMLVTQNEKSKSLGSGEKAAAKLDQAADRFYHKIRAKRLISPGLKNLVVHNAFRAMSLSGYSGSERDTAYWRDSGLGGTTYPTKTGPLKRCAGALIYHAASGMTKAAGRAYTKKQK